jgi:hypothetical protein
LKAEPASTFKLLVVYGDSSGRARAHQCLESLVEYFGEGRTFLAWYLKFEDLLRSHVQQLASQEVAQTDLVLFAVPEEAELPEEVKHWTETWRAANGHPPMVGIVSAQAPDRAERRMACEHLQAVAARTGMRFLGEASA